MNKEYTLYQLIEDVHSNKNFKYRITDTIKVWKPVGYVHCSRDVIEKCININRFVNGTSFRIRIWYGKGKKVVSVQNLSTNKKYINENVKLLNMVLREFAWGFISIKFMRGVEQNHLKLNFVGYNNPISIKIDVKDNITFQI